MRLKGSVVKEGKKKAQTRRLKPLARTERRVRSDAKRNLDVLLRAAKEVFARSGVDAPVREIAEKAGFGIGTLYRHFPQRADLVAAVFRHELDSCADAADDLAAQYGPGEALAKWMQRYAELVATKRGLAAALHSGKPIFETLPAYFDLRLRPAFKRLVEAAVGAGEIRSDVDPDELLMAVASLCRSADNNRPGYSRRMVALLVDGLRRDEPPEAHGSPAARRVYPRSKP